jgi:hypothetical protein
LVITDRSYFFSIEDQFLSSFRVHDDEIAEPFIRDRVY